MSGNVYRLSKTMKSVGNNLWLWVKTLKRDCGSVRIIADHDPRIMRILKISLEWVYIIFNWKLLGKTQGKREHQGPSVINKPRLWVKMSFGHPRYKCTARCGTLGLTRGSSVPKITNNVIWCQETFTHSQKRWKVLETIFGCGSKHLKGTAVHLRFICTATCGTFVPPNLAWMGLYHF